MAKKKKKRGLTSNVTVGGPGIDTHSLREVVESEPRAFIGKVQSLIEDEGMRWRDIKSLMTMFRNLHGIGVESEVTIIGGAEPITQAITADAFNLLCGNLTIAGIQDGIEAYPAVAGELVTEMEDPHDISIVAGIASMNPEREEVKETEEYPPIGATDETFAIHSKRNGVRLDISKDMLEKNKVGDIIRRVDALSEIAAETVEELSLKRIIDLDGSGSTPAAPYVLELNGTATQLYTTTANAPSKRTPNGTRINNNALNDYANLDAVREVLALNVNSRGKPVNIPVSEMIILGPDGIASQAAAILNSEMSPGVQGERNPWGTQGQFKIKKIITTPWLDRWSASAWYMGLFKKQFTRKSVHQFEYVTLGMDTESFLRRRVAFQARLAWNVEIGATATEYVVQSLADTTQPAVS